RDWHSRKRRGRKIPSTKTWKNRFICVSPSAQWKVRMWIGSRHCFVLTQGFRHSVTWSEHESHFSAEKRPLEGWRNCAACPLLGAAYFSYAGWTAEARSARSLRAGRASRRHRRALV